MGDVAISPPDLFPVKAIDRLESFFAPLGMDERKPAHGLGRFQLSSLSACREEENQKRKPK
jgi:hypothetical protein